MSALAALVPAVAALAGVWLGWQLRGAIGRQERLAGVRQAGSTGRRDPAPPTGGDAQFVAAYATERREQVSRFADELAGGDEELRARLRRFEREGPSAPPWTGWAP